MQYTFQTINRLRQSWQQDNSLMNSSSCDSNDDKIDSTKDMIINNNQNISNNNVSTKRASSTVIRNNKKSSVSNDDCNLRHSINISDLPPRRPERKSTKSSFSTLIDSLAIQDIDERQCHNDNTATPQQQQLLSLSTNDVGTIIAPNQILRQLAEEEVDAVVALNESIDKPDNDSDLEPITHDELNDGTQQLIIVQQHDLDDTIRRGSATTSSTAPTAQAPRRRSTMNGRERLSMIRVIHETSLSYDSCISSCTFDGSNAGFDESYAVVGQESRFDVCFSETTADGTQEADPNTKRNGPAQPRRRSTLSTCYVVESNDESNDEI